MQGEGFAGWPRGERDSFGWLSGGSSAPRVRPRAISTFSPRALRLYSEVMGALQIRRRAKVDESAKTGMQADRHG